MSVRVRYAPSPTGLQHIGSVRTALFNYLLARSRNGTFILRIEDTDRERTHPEAMQDIYDTFRWLGIEWDEGPDKTGEYGPYVQSERQNLYREHAEKLLASGHAYRCYCSAERLEKLREQQSKNKKGAVGYDRHCRSLSEEEIANFQREGRTSVIRLKVPEQGDTRFTDELLGEVKTRNKDIPPDPIILKSDGFPTYHLANVVDDHHMEITHILRAQEWLPSVPLHIQLYEAFGWQPPRFVHLPMVLGTDGQKLSKRHGATSVREFRREGYLPEALINYLALLGWSLDDSTEFFTREELERVFSIDRLNKAPGVFDYKKLAWFNGNYIRRKSREELADLLIPYLTDAGFLDPVPTGEQREKLDTVVPLVQERLKVLSEAPELVRFVFEDPGAPEPVALVPKKMEPQDARTALGELKKTIAGFPERDDEELENSFRDLAEKLGIKMGQLLMPLRVAVTGSSVSPPLIGCMRLLGPEETERRIDRAIDAFG